MQTKLSKLIELLLSGDEAGAMRIAARFPDLGSDKVAIRAAWDSRQNPSLYQQLGKDPARLWSEGLAALRKRYAAAIQKAGAA